MGKSRTAEVVWSCDAKGCDRYEQRIEDLPEGNHAQAWRAPDGWMKISGDFPVVWICPDHAEGIWYHVYRMPLK